MTQKSFGKEFGIGSAGMVSQYLNAKRPLGLNAAIKFAKGLEVQVADISPTLAAQLPQPAVNPPNEAQKRPLALTTQAKLAPSFEDALRVIAVALSEADQSDRNAAKAYLVELCDRPEDVDTFAAKLQRTLLALPVQANSTNH